MNRQVDFGLALMPPSRKRAPTSLREPRREEMYYAASVSSPDGGRARFCGARTTRSWRKPTGRANAPGSAAKQSGYALSLRLLRESAGEHADAIYKDCFKRAREHSTASEARPAYR